MACKFVLDRAAHKLQKTILLLVLTQLLLKLRCEQVEQFGIPSDEWLRCVGGTKNNHIACCSNDDLAA